MYSQPTIKDVAKVAGVHFTTVSMALRAHPSIPAATRERILAAASRVGYQRNPVYAALTSQRMGGKAGYFVPKIAYLSNRSPEEGFYRLGHNELLVEGARRQAEALGYSLEVLFLDKGHLSAKTLGSQLRRLGIAGLILGALEPGRPVPDVDWSAYSLVKIDSRHVSPAVNFVSTNQFDSVRASLGEMRALGYCRLGLAIGQDDETSTDSMHLSAWELEQSRLPAGQRIPPLLFPSRCSTAEVIDLLARYIPEHRLDGILCNWTNIRSMLTRAGYGAESGIGCACLCLTRPMPGLAGMVTNMDLVGERAVFNLSTLMRLEQRGVPACPLNTYVKGEWRHGASARERR